jgi:pimeloyl-ACP methyl ester carboxylesterase
MEQTRPTGTGLRATLAALAALIALAAVAAHAGGASARQLDTSGSASPAHSTSLSGDTRAAQLIRHSIVARLGTAARPTGASAASSAISGSPCGDTPGLICSQIDVPLDHTGQTQGTVSLHVETLPAFGAQKGVMFLIAGGPGQGSAHVFGLGSPDSVILYRYLFPGYTLVAYDDRGTGSSGLLNCPALQGNVSVEQEDKIAAACADSIGPNRAFYSTRDHAEDIESVRLALGVDKVALWGTSYGTKLAMAYALAHPDHVERLLLDSVVPPDLNDPFGASDLREMPTTLSALCAETSCRTADANLARDVATLANRLAAKPIQGKVRLANGKTRATRISGVDLLSLVIDADLSPGLAAELPATVKAALQGNVQPLLRLYDLDAVAGSEPAEDLSAGL